MRRKKQQPKITLTELIAVNRTAPARRLLSKHGMPDAVSYADLKQKLEGLYADTQDKIALEKEIAEMHPHKEFILKYCGTAPLKTAVTAEDVTVQNNTNTAQIMKQYSNCSGNPDCSCGHSNACGCSGFSGADGTGHPAPRVFNLPGGQQKSGNLELVAVVSIVAIVALLIYNKKI